VWKAHDTRLNRSVAIKFLRHESALRFQQEARAIAALGHPHICVIFDVGPDYLVLEFVEGAPLQEPLSATEALPLAAQIAGASRRRISAESCVDATRTTEGTALGTAAYISPEQARGRPSDARSDIFSFGGAAV
jgi:serine/threonine protein kinase